jgi:hypothetical protein
VCRISVALSNAWKMRRGRHGTYVYNGTRHPSLNPPFASSLLVPNNQASFHQHSITKDNRPLQTTTSHLDHPSRTTNHPFEPYQAHSATAQILMSFFVAINKNTGRTFIPLSNHSSKTNKPNNPSWRASSNIKRQPTPSKTISQP